MQFDGYFWTYSKGKCPRFKMSFNIFNDLFCINGNNGETIYRSLIPGYMKNQCLTYKSKKVDRMNFLAIKSSMIKSTHIDE